MWIAQLICFTWLTEVTALDSGYEDRRFIMRIDISLWKWVIKIKRRIPSDVNGSGDQLGTNLLWSGQE